METVTYKATYNICFCFKFENKTWIYSDCMDFSHQHWELIHTSIDFLENKFIHY